MEPISVNHAATQTLETNKVLKNTYALLSMTLLFSAAMSAVAVSVGLGQGASMICFFGALGLVWLVLPRTANKTSGIFVVFGITGLLGLSIGPMIGYYMATEAGAQIVTTALGGTGMIFLGLSGYALTSRKDFSFLAGFLMIGLFTALIAIVANIFLNIPALSLTISAVVILIMSGFILYDTSQIIRGGQTNYILATVGLYLSIFNIFIHLLSILGIFGGDD